MRPGQWKHREPGEWLGSRRSRRQRSIGRGQGFRRRCLRNRPGQEEAPHLLEVALGEAPTELGGQIAGETLEQLLAVGCPRGATLFMLDDSSADRPVGGCHDGVHRARSSAAGRLDETHDVGQHGIVAARAGPSDRALLRLHQRRECRDAADGTSTIREVPHLFDAAAMNIVWAQGVRRSDAAGWSGPSTGGDARAGMAARWPARRRIRPPSRCTWRGAGPAKAPEPRTWWSRAHTRSRSM